MSTRTSIELTARQEETTSETSEAVAIQYPSGSKLILTIIALALTIFLVALDSTIIAQAIPALTQQFGNIADITWYSTTYSLSNTAFKLVWGKAYKRFPLKSTYLLSIIIFEVGNVIAAVAETSTAVILGRLISGIGGGGLMCGSFIIMALTVKPERRAMMMGITSLTFGVSSVLGPLLGGVLVDTLSWRWCFWINLPIGAVATGIIVLFFKQPAHVVPEQNTITKKLSTMDLQGSLLVAGSLTCFTLAMNWLSKTPSNNAGIIGSFIGSAALFFLFVGNEKIMGTNAMLEPHLLRNSSITRNCAYAFFLSGTYFPLLYILPIQFQSIGGQTAAESGVRLIPMALGVSIFTLITNGILTFWKYYSPIFVFGAIITTAGASIMYTFNINTASGSWIGSEVLVSAGVGAALQLPVLANVAAVGIDDIAAATSLALFFENVGTTIFLATTDGAFTRGLIRGVETRLPNLDPQVVINSGATHLRSKYSDQMLPKILAAYLDACKDSHLVPIACASLAGLLAVGSAMPKTLKQVRSWWSKSHTR